MKTFSLSLWLLVLGSSICFADDLEARLNKARADKAVVEQSSGYLKAVSGDKTVEALVAEINKKRKEKYSEVAAETKGATLEAVEKAAGAKLVEKYK